MTSLYPGMKYPQITSNSNPNSTSTTISANSLKQSNNNRLLTGGAGVAPTLSSPTTINVPQFQSSGTNNSPTTANSVIQKSSQISTQSLSNSQYDKYAFIKGGKKKCKSTKYKKKCKSTKYKRKYKSKSKSKKHKEKKYK